MDPISLPKVQRAAEVSFDRACVRVKHFSPQAFFQRRYGTIAYQFASALGFSMKKSDLQLEDDLVGPALACSAYGVSVCFGQIYVLPLVLATWAVGSLLVFLLFRMLGSSHDLARVASAVGCSTLPLLVLQPIVAITEDPLPWFSLGIKCLAVLLASRSASLVLVQPSTEKKLFLFELPLLLLYVYLLGYRSGA
ncbi:hypothetical protein BASA81_001390 [Batrachochytrium salamandrivorans]|nr:hypothetical protein BASA81_001390 [Batrachochytrium salamandrivorans]